MRLLCLLVVVSMLSVAGAEELFRQKTGNGVLSLDLVVLRQRPDSATASPQLLFQYEVTNHGKDAWALFTKGHTGESFKGIAYCEALGEQQVEYSLKAFQKPAGSNCPLRYLPVTPKAMLLQPGETVRGQAVAMLPPQIHTPFDDCLPVPSFSDSIEKARLCLGVTRLSDAAAHQVTRGNVSVAISDRQILLCSDLFDL